LIALDDKFLIFVEEVDGDGFILIANDFPIFVSNSMNALKCGFFSEASSVKTTMFVFAIY
jgi:hypothetical protein